ncbi:MAG: hypothetical protein M5U28_35855 [Sandaracinaceae bacterium]|nr:hypothetical protein [Sandaracinaceae bacterium]
MTNRQRLLFLVALACAPLAAACENPFDTSCPAGYWRPRAMEDCVPLPVADAGRDSGPTPIEDAGTDAAAPSDAGSDAAAADDASTSDASTSDADVPDADLSDADVDVPDGSAGDGG